MIVKYGSLLVFALAQVRVADEAFEEKLLVTSQGARVTWSWAPDAPLPYACSLHRCVYEAELSHHTFDARAPDAVPTIHKAPVPCFSLLSLSLSSK